MFGIAVGTINRLLSANWDEIVERVPSDLLPREKPVKRHKHAVDEYGCGHYGCVAPTGRPNVVVKITTDPTEIRFVKAAMKIGEWPEGIVRYYDIMELRGGFRGRPSYMIWREEAHNVGEWDYMTAEQHVDYDYKVRALQDFAERLDQFKHFASVVREAARVVPYEAVVKHEQWAWDRFALEDVEHLHMPPRLRADYRMAWSLRALTVITEMMGSEPEGNLVGDALAFYLDHKIVLADVHTNNIGEVNREDGSGVLVITDPGHAVELE